MTSSGASEPFLLDDTVNRCFCPHAGPCCHLDHGCCGSCCDEAERRDLEDEFDDA